MISDSIIKSMINAVRKIDYCNIIKEGKELIGYNPSGDETLRFDKMIEGLIVKYLRESGYDGVIRGEEKESYLGDKKKGIIIIDPIDGSLNALRGIPFYATLIAYAEGEFLSDVTRAIVYAPALNKIYVAIKNKGAYKLEKNKLERIKITDSYLLKPIINVSSVYTFKFTRILSRYGKIRRIGSIGLAIAFASEGLIDVVIDLGKRARVPDVAAPFLILMEAGGKIVRDNKISLDPKNRLNFIVGKEKMVNKLKKELWDKRKRKNSTL